MKKIILDALTQVEIKKFKLLTASSFLVLIFLTLVIYTGENEIFFFSNLGSSLKKYTQYPVHNISYIYFIVSLLMASIPSLLVKLEPWKPSNIFVILMYALVFIPIQIITPFMDSSFNYDIFSFNIIIFICFCMMIYFLNIEVKLLNFSKFELKGDRILLALIALQILFVSIIIIKIGINFDLTLPNSFSAEGFFNQRLINRVQLESAIVKYPFNLLCNLLNPVLFVITIHFRRNLIAIYVFIIQIYIASIVLSKLAFIILPLTIIIYFMFKKSLRLFIITFMGYLITMSMLALIPDLGFAYNQVHRLMHLHALLTHYSIELFKDDGFRLYSDIAFIREILNLPVPELPIPQFIGKYSYYNNPQTFANENFWATAYANAGLLGVIIESIIVTIALKIFDNFSYLKNKEITSCLILFPIITLTSASTLTMMASGGFILALIISVILPRDKNFHY